MRCFFEPRSIAVVGASSNQRKGGYTIVDNLVSAFAGTTYPINPKAETIRGLRCYPSVADVPGEVDLAIVIIPAEDIPEVLRQCGKKGVKGVIIESAGFAEIGPAGKQLQDEIVAIAKDAGMRLWGPNCTGVVDAHSGVVTSFLNVSDVIPGGVSIVSQSGMMAGAMLKQVITTKMFGLSKGCAIGNKCDVDESDVLEYLADDDSTTVIGMYLESIGDGARFVNAARRALAKKPIIALKGGGHGEAGRKAALSHTASLAEDDRIVDAIFQQLGITRVDDITEMLDLCKVFSMCSLPGGRRIAQVTLTGGGGVVAADAMDRNSLTLSDLTAETVQNLREIFRPWAPAGNPVDISASSELYGVQRCVEHSLQSVLPDPNVDGVLVMLVAAGAFNDLDPDRVAAVIHQYAKPVLFWMAGDVKYVVPWTQELHAHSVPVLRDIKTAVKALAAMSDYASVLQRRGTSSAERAAESRDLIKTCRSLVSPIVSSGRRTCTEYEAKRILSAYAIPITREAVAFSEDEAVDTACSLGYPVALKILHPDIRHKTEVGGVKLSLDGDEAVRVAFREIAAIPRNGDSTAVLVQAMAAQGAEVIIGMTRDPKFGPVLMFGLGGILVEALEDVAFAVPPLDAVEAERLVRRTRAFRILNGWRNRPAADIEAIKQVLVAVSRIAVELPEIDQIDINPLIVYARGEGAKVVDALITLNR